MEAEGESLMAISSGKNALLVCSQSQMEAYFYPRQMPKAFTAREPPQKNTRLKQPNFSNMLLLLIIELFPHNKETYPTT